MKPKSDQLQCLIAPISNGKILLPKASVTEVIAYHPPEPFEASPEWVLGSIMWKGWQVPVMSFANLLNMSGTESTKGARLMIVKSFVDSQKMPYLGILVQGAPKLKTITPDKLAEQPEKHRLLGVFSNVKVDKQDAIIPDLHRLSQLIAHAAYGALPITRI